MEQLKVLCVFCGGKIDPPYPLDSSYLWLGQCESCGAHYGFSFFVESEADMARELARVVYNDYSEDHILNEKYEFAFIKSIDFDSWSVLISDEIYLPGMAVFIRELENGKINNNRSGGTFKEKL